MKQTKVQIGFLVALFFCRFSGAAEPSPAQEVNEVCRLGGSTDLDRGKAVIFGKDYRVPELHFRFVDERDGHSILVQTVEVRYLWQWLEYPYPEHDWGAWSDAREDIVCSPNENRLVVPSRTVRPRGWYNGKYTRFPWAKNPHFDRLEIPFVFGECRQTLIIQARQLRRYKDQVAVIHFASSCTGIPRVSFEKEPQVP